MGAGQQRWITKFPNVNVINFAKVNKGGGIKRVSTKSGYFAFFVLYPSLSKTMFFINYAYILLYKVHWQLTSSPLQ